MKLHEKIKSLQIEQNLKNTELSRLANIPNSTLADILKGRTEKISLQTIIMLSNALDCTIDYLAYDDITDRYFGEEYSVDRSEYQLIKKYRALDEHGKEVTDFILNAEYTRCTSATDKQIDLTPGREITLEELESMTPEELYAVSLPAPPMKKEEDIG